MNSTKEILLESRIWIIEQKKMSVLFLNIIMIVQFSHSIRESALYSLSAYNIVTETQKFIFNTHRFIVVDLLSQKSQI